MKFITKFLATLFVIIPFSVSAATLVKAPGQIRTRIIAFTNEKNIMNSVVKNMAGHPATTYINNTIIGTNIIRQDTTLVNIEVIF